MVRMVGGTIAGLTIAAAGADPGAVPLIIGAMFGAGGLTSFYLAWSQRGKFEAEKSDTIQTAVNTAVNTITDVLHVTKAELDATREKAGKLEAKVETLKLQLDNAEGDRDVLRRRLVVAEQDLRVSRARIEALEDQVRKFEKRR